MDDETCRPGVKDDLTCRDEYLATRFTRLSASGHDLTPMTMEEIQRWNEEHLSDYIPFMSNTTTTTLSSNDELNYHYLGMNQKGVYVCNIGGLPVFSSGSRIPHFYHTHLVFSEPCDEEHIKLVEVHDDELVVVYNVTCARSNTTIGEAIKLPSSPHISSSSSSSPPSYAYQYVIDPKYLIFLPLRSKWPIPSQPENYWGTEGMFTVWMMN